jgi:predicted ArsR family transcriptional regulator
LLPNNLKELQMPKRKTNLRPAIAPPKTTKSDQLKTLLAKPGGVTVADLSEKLGWQSHTTRAALTRLKQSGLSVERLDPKEGSRQSRYRIAGAKK